MLALTPCSRATRAIDAPGCIACSTILRFSAMLRRCRLSPSAFAIADPSTHHLACCSVQVMIALLMVTVQVAKTVRLRNSGDQYRLCNPIDRLGADLYECGLPGSNRHYSKWRSPARRVPVSGTETDASGVVHGFTLSRNGSFNVSDPPGSTATTPNFISPQGTIVGGYVDAAGVSHGFILSGGQYTTLDFPGAAGTQLTGINPSGEISGFPCVVASCASPSFP